MTYMGCLDEKSSSPNDQFLNFIHKQLVYDKLAEFNGMVSRAVHLAMYERLFNGVQFGIGIPRALSDRFVLNGHS